jgi:predicted transcriptional regulator
MMSNQDNKSTLPGLTAEIVTAYLRNHPMAAVEVPMLVATVARELGGLGREPEEPAQPEPAVSIRRSVQRDHLVCLICGKKLKSLRRHLAIAHDLTPSGYRDQFGLKRDYPIVAPSYAEQRAAIARGSGLGLRQAPEPALAAEEAGPKPSQEPAPPEARRGRRATRKAETAPDAVAAQKPRRGRRTSQEPTQAPPPARRRAG